MRSTTLTRTSSGLTKAEPRIEAYAVGYDLGGTKLASALVDQGGRILSHLKTSVLEAKKNPRPPRGQAQLVDLMVEAFRHFLKSHPQAFHPRVFRGFGLASAGPLDVEKGELVYPVNFPGWKRFSIVKALEKALLEEFSHSKISRGKKVGPWIGFQNDAVAAGLAEGWVGRGQGLSSYAVITVGTGIGTGVIFNGRPVQTHGKGSEFGHLLIQENRVERGQEDRSLKKFTVEGLASGTGIVRRAREELGFPGSSVEELLHWGGVDLTQKGLGSKFSKKVSGKEPGVSVRNLFLQAGDALGALCYNLSVGFNLERIFFSGGLMAVDQLFLGQTKQRYDALIRAWNPSFRAPIQKAGTLHHAGVIGAASLPLISRSMNGSVTN